MPTEATLQAHLMTLCRNRGILCMKFSSPSRRGVPDLVLLYKGHTCFVEMKSPNKTGALTKHQKHYLEIIQAQGIPCYVSDTKEENNRIVAVVLANGQAERGD